VLCFPDFTENLNIFLFITLIYFENFLTICSWNPLVFVPSAIVYIYIYIYDVIIFLILSHMMI